MKATFFTIVAFATAALAAPAATKTGIDANKALDIPKQCAVCDAFGAACVAACIAGGPADPLCDICAGPAIGTCLSCLGSS